MKLEDIMVAQVIQASPEESIGEAAKRMREKSVGCLVLSIDDVVKGIITDRDLLACLGRGHDPYRCKIAAHMTHPVIVLQPEEDHVTAANVMRKRRIKRLPIARRGKLVGIVSISDLAAVAEDEVEKLWPSWVFITGLNRMQANQGHRVKVRAAVQEDGLKKAVA
jgi:signal-transduction protein with cAMP-binding, CBS, and nucleotidyltransferase domain